MSETFVECTEKSTIDHICENGLAVVNELENNCLDYFKSSPVWKHLFNGFYEKFVSYGDFKGSVTLEKLSLNDIETLEGFFGKNFHGKTSIKITAAQFKKAIEMSRFASVKPQRVMELFFGKKPKGRKDAELEEKRLRDNVINECITCFTDTPAAQKADFIQYIVKRILKGNDANNYDLLKKYFHLCAEIINSLPYRTGKTMYLAVFAAMVTGNPHMFDSGAEKTLLDNIIKNDIEERNVKLQYSNIFSAHNKQRKYLAVGIMIDEISNHALFYGVRAVKKQGGMHKGMEGFLAEGAPVQIPLAVIKEFEELQCPNKKIYIVENPSVFAYLCEKADEKTALMCMNGQPCLAEIMALDLLAASGTVIFYSGDFDPEGLQIAQKLSKYYQGEFNYWHMSAEDYELCVSGEKISDRRLKMLDNITDERLMPAVRMMRKSHVAGYQETLLIKKIYN